VAIRLVRGSVAVVSIVAIQTYDRAGWRTRRTSIESTLIPTHGDWDGRGVLPG
jgi:hypothetical protein